jgi:hypothetical protein
MRAIIHKAAGLSLFMAMAMTGAARAEDTAPKSNLMDSGRLLLTQGVSNVDGAAGGGLATWAVISGYGQCLAARLPVPHLWRLGRPVRPGRGVLREAELRHRRDGGQAGPGPGLHLQSGRGRREAEGLWRRGLRPGQHPAADRGGRAVQAQRPQRHHPRGRRQERFRHRLLCGRDQGAARPEPGPERHDPRHQGQPGTTTKPSSKARSAI